MNSFYSLIGALSRNRCLIIIVILAGASFFLNIGASDRFSRAESYFSLGSRMMIETGDWLLMHSPQELPLNKPPIQYWVIGISYLILGIDYGPGRIPSGVFALCIIIITYFFGQRRFGTRTGVAASAMLGTSWLLWSFARLAMPDILLTLCIAVSIYCWMLVLDGESKYGPVLALIGHAALAVGFLVKGPVAILLAGAPFLIELVVSRDLSIIRKLRPFSGLAIFLSIAAPYFILVYLRDGFEPLRTWFINENIRRFAGATYLTRSSALEFALTSLIVGFAPWSILFLIAALRDFRARRSHEPGRRTLRLLYIWTIFPVAFFAVSQFRLDYYVLPSFLPASLLTARMVANEQVAGVWFSRSLYLFTALVAVCSVGTSVFLFVAAPVELYPNATLLYACAIMIAFGSIPAFLCIYLRRSKDLIFSTCFAIWLIFVSTTIFLLPQTSQFNPIERMCSTINADTNVYVLSDADEWTADIMFHVPVTTQVVQLVKEAEINSVNHLLSQDKPVAFFLYEDALFALQTAGFSPAVVDQGDVYKGKRITIELLVNPQLRRLYLVSN